MKNDYNLQGHLPVLDGLRQRFPFIPPSPAAPGPLGIDAAAAIFITGSADAFQPFCTTVGYTLIAVFYSSLLRGPVKYPTVCIFFTTWR